MNTRFFFLLACISTRAILGATTLSWALNERSHRLGNGEAASQATLYAHLREHLGLFDKFRPVQKAGEPRVYFVYFAPDADGLWRIGGM